MITEDKIVPKLREEGIDALITSTPMHVFYTTGLITSTTITPHPENFEETGFYYDTPQSPPKNMSVWTADDGGPYLVIAPNESGQLPNIDVEETVVYMPEDFSTEPPDDPTEDERVIHEALENNYDSIYDALEATLDGLVDEGSRVALERASMSPTVYGHIENLLPCDDITEATSLLHRLRLVKTDEEVQRLRRAAEENEGAIYDAMDELEVGMTEREFANIFREKQAARGCRNRHCHIGFGPNSANGHCVPGDYEIQPGDLVRFEVGCYYVDDGDLNRQIDPRHTYYPGDLARTYAFKEASDEHRNQYRVIYEAMEEGRRQMADGASTRRVHEHSIAQARETAREVGADGMVDYESHMMGHNIGLDCHDHPLLSPEMSKYGHDTLRKNMVMNWELAHLVQGVGGIQIEETGVITEDGVEAFTASPEELPVVG